MASSCSVFLNVNDLSRSLAFYRSLGFRVDRTYDDEETGAPYYADLSYDGAEFGLGHIPANDDKAFRDWVGTPLGAGVVVYFTVPNADRAYAAAQKAGATIEMPLTDRPYGRMFTVNDPDGYTLSFITEPKPRKAARKAKRAAPKKAKRPAKKATRKGAKKAARRSR